MPDFVIFSEDETEVRLIEVKYRNRPPSEVEIGREIGAKIRRFWPDSVLVFVPLRRGLLRHPERRDK
jgi:hypothetical protein